MKPQALTSPLVGPPLKAQSSRPLLTAFFRPVPGLISRIGSSNFCAMDVVGYASPCRSRTLDDHDRAIICEKRREKGKREGTGTAHRRWSAAEESLLWEHGNCEPGAFKSRTSRRGGGSDILPSCLSERDGHRGSWVLLQPLRAVDAKCRMMCCRWKKSS